MRKLIQLFAVALTITIAGVLNAATFTSTGAGNWNDGATWGNTSPGVKGTDWPGVAADVANVGHTVTYNVSETNEMGQIDITSGGILTFDTTANTKLTMGNVDLIVRSGGELRVGTSGAVIPAAYTADLIWNTTGDNAKGIYVYTGGKLNIYGDPTYYGSDDETTLANDADNTDGDVYIVTSDDMSSLWNVGDEITIKVENAGDSTSYQDAIKLGTIQSISGTLVELDITITAAAGVGSTWTAPVINVTRNVKLSKLSASTAIANYNSNRPRIYDENASGNNNCVISNAMITGFYAIDSDYDFQFLNSVFRNGYYAFNSGSNHTVSGNVYGNFYGFNRGSNHTVSGNNYSNNNGFFHGANHTVSGNVYSNSYGFNNGVNHTVSGNVYSNNIGFINGSDHTVSGNVYSNNYAFYQFSNYTVCGKLGYDSGDVSSPNTYDFFNGSGIYLRACKLPLAGLLFDSRGSDLRFYSIYSEDHNQTLAAHYAYYDHADVVKNTATVRSGGAASSIEVIPLSTMVNGAYVKFFEWAEQDVPATAQARSVYIKGDAWSGYPTNTQLYIEAEYLDHATLLTRSTAVSTEVLTDTTWTQFNLSFTPLQQGIVRYRGYLKKYEAAKKIYVDNQLNKE